LKLFGLASVISLSLRATKCPVIGARQEAILSALGHIPTASTTRAVASLRQLHEPARQTYYPGRSPSELFALRTLDQVRIAGAEHDRTLITEVGREAATIVMLAAVAFAVVRNAGQWATGIFWDCGGRVW
jgi:hypothetical protein